MIIFHFEYICIMIIMTIGIFGTISCDNLVKKLLSLSIFQSSIIMLYLAIGFIHDSAAPIISNETPLYSNPIPQVLMLTAIVVGVATTTLGLSFIINISHEYKTISEHEIIELTNKANYQT